MARQGRRIIRRRTDEEFHEAIPASQTSFIERSSPMLGAAAVVGWALAVVEGILAMRLLFELLSANPNTGVVSLIFSVSRPLVSPFFSALGGTLNAGIGTLEMSTIVAMLVYALVAYLLRLTLTAFASPGEY